MDFDNARITVPDHVLAREVGDELVILNLDNEQYYGLDAVGAAMWTTLTTTPTIQASLEKLHAEYDVELDQLKNDLETLINDLQQDGLLEVVDR